MMNKTQNSFRGYMGKLPLKPLGKHLLQILQHKFNRES